MNEKLERLLPDLAIFKYSIRNPARYDLQIDLVQCVLDQLIETERVLPLRRFVEITLQGINNQYIKSDGSIKEVLQQMELNLGMSVPDWPPENIDELAKKYEDPFNK